VLGIVFGHVALSQIRRTGEQGRGLAIAGLVIGYAFVGLFLLLVVAVAVVGSAA
jgi:peptidyl-prolyl cis-trans isomerase B (cyclophilin B)